MPPPLHKHLLIRKGDAIYSLRAGESRARVEIVGFQTLVIVRDKLGDVRSVAPEDLL